MESDSLGARTEISSHFRSRKIHWNCIGDRKHIQKCGLLRNWNEEAIPRVGHELRQDAEQLHRTFGHFPNNTKRQKICERVFYDTISFGTMNLESDGIVNLVTYNRQL